MPINFSLNLPLISHCFLRTLSPEEQTETVFPARHTTVYLHRGNAKAKSGKSLSSAGCLPQETCFLFVFPLSVERTLRCVLQQKKKMKEGEFCQNLNLICIVGRIMLSCVGCWLGKEKPTRLAFPIFPPTVDVFFTYAHAGECQKSLHTFRAHFYQHPYILRFARLRSPSMSNLPAREEKKQKKGDEIKEISWSEQWQE